VNASLEKDSLIYGTRIEALGVAGKEVKDVVVYR